MSYEEIHYAWAVEYLQLGCPILLYQKIHTLVIFSTSLIIYTVCCPLVSYFGCYMDEFYKAKSIDNLVLTQERLHLCNKATYMKCNLNVHIHSEIL